MLVCSETCMEAYNQYYVNVFVDKEIHHTYITGVVCCIVILSLHFIHCSQMDLDSSILHNPRVDKICFNMSPPQSLTLSSTEVRLDHSLLVLHTYTL